MQSMMDDPAFKLYAIASTIVALHMILLALWTGRVRARYRTFTNPEDARWREAGHAEVDHAEVARVKRAHQNAVENAVPFFAVGFLYAASGATRNGALAYFSTFATARVLHSIFYLRGRQPFRTLMFGLGVLAILGMALHVVRAAL